jgi:hypothetical protein
LQEGQPFGVLKSKHKERCPRRSTTNAQMERFKKLVLRLLEIQIQTFMLGFSNIQLGAFTANVLIDGRFGGDVNEHD